LRLRSRTPRREVHYRGGGADHMRSNRLGLAMILVTGFAAAQSKADGPPPSVRAVAEGVVSAQPDRAEIDIGVLTQAATAQAAASKNAAATQAVLDRLRKTLGSKADIRTTSYSLNPDYRFDQGKQTLSGYSATNTVEIVSDDLPGIGKVIDAATEGGANQIQQLRFVLKDEKPARAEALRRAAVEARSNAAAMAAALGLKLGRVLMVEQGTGQPSPSPRVFAKLATAETPIEPQGVEVRATVTLTIAVE
jgi:uncharacterized protein YggE